MTANDQWRADREADRLFETEEQERAREEEESERRDWQKRNAEKCGCAGTDEWCPCQNDPELFTRNPVAPAPGDRFYIDHGMIHDRVTGKHVTTEQDTPWCDGISACCALLNSLALAANSGTARHAETFPTPPASSGGVGRETVLVEALKEARDLFAEYEQLHLAKTPPDLAKAHRNCEAKTKCDLALLSGRQQ